MKKIGAVFSGQGTQRAGMGKELCSEYKIARETFEEANDVLNMDLMELCFHGSEEELKKTENSQMAIVCYSTALYRVFKECYGIKPTVFAGHSVGEYSALVAGEVLTFEQALKIVRKRGELMAKATKNGAMAAIVGGNNFLIKDYCNKVSQENGVLAISNYNSVKQTVISGDKQLVDAAVTYFEGQGVVVKPLKVSSAFHSPLMESIVPEFVEVLNQYDFAKPINSIISNVTADKYVDQIREKLAVQLVSPVQWVKTMDYFHRNLVDAVVEFGPGKSLRNFFKDTYKEIRSFSFDNNKDKEAFKELEGESNYKKIQFDYFVDKVLSIVACTKNNSGKDDEYQRYVINKCNEIRSKKSVDFQQIRVQDEICEMIETLVTILDFKKVSQKEKMERLQDLAAMSLSYEIQNIILDKIKNC